MKFLSIILSPRLILCVSDVNSKSTATRRLLLCTHLCLSPKTHTPLCVILSPYVPVFVYDSENMRGAKWLRNTFQMCTHVSSAFQINTPSAVNTGSLRFRCLKDCYHLANTPMHVMKEFNVICISCIHLLV